MDLPDLRNPIEMWISVAILEQPEKVCLGSQAPKNPLSEPLKWCQFSLSTDHGPLCEASAPKTHSIHPPTSLSGGESSWEHTALAVCRAALHTRTKKKHRTNAHSGVGLDSGCEFPGTGSFCQVAYVTSTHWRLHWGGSSVDQSNPESPVDCQKNGLLGDPNWGISCTSVSQNIVELNF